MSEHFFILKLTTKSKAKIAINESDPSQTQINEILNALDLELMYH